MERAMRSIVYTPGRLFAMLLLLASPGCASFSNPTTFPSIPVRRLPDDVLGKPREDQIDVPGALLRQVPPDEYRLDAGDTLGIVLDNVVGIPGQLPPVNFPAQGALSQNIGVGFPFPVFDDGTIIMPLLKEPIKIRGLTVPEAQQAIFKAYAESGTLDEKNIKLQVTLYRPRLYKVLVVRQDSGAAYLGSAGALNAKRGSGQVLDLPAYENDVLTALTRSGGLPGLDARNEAIIQRGTPKETLTTMPTGPIAGVETIRVPLRLRPGETIPFTKEDVILQNGDIVFVQSRDTEVFYVAGVVPLPGEYPIPRDYDLDVLEAIMQVRGPVANGGVNANNLSGSIFVPGIGQPSPSQVTVVRKCPGNRQITIRVDLNRALQDPRERLLVQPGDILIIQETLGEAFTRYMTTKFSFNFFGTFLRQRDAVGTFNTILP